MKGIFKVMTVALAAGSLASCTDKLDDLRSNDLVAQENQLIATLPEIGGGEAQTRVGVYVENGVGNYVWAEDDEINVYGLNSLDYENYTIKAGESGGNQAVFEKQKSANLSGTKYAVTQPQGSDVIYGVSSKNGEALLTATIPASFDWDVVATNNGKTAYAVESPFWGPATVSGSGIKVTFKALTSFLKVDMSKIPANTKALVLTTHEDFTINDGANDVVYPGGANEPLSGTMSAILDIDNPQSLQADKKLASNDTIRVNFDIDTPAGEDKILYIPVPAGTYQKMYLLAVYEDNKLPYNYNDAEVIREWDDKEFVLGSAVSIAITDEKDLSDITSPLALSNAIANLVAESGNHTVRVLAGNLTPVAGTDDNLYIATNLPGQTSVEITFANDAAFADALNIVECPLTTGMIGGATWKTAEAATALSVSGDKARTVRLSFEGEDPVEDLNIFLPTSNVEITNKSVTNYTAASAGTPNTLGTLTGIISIVAANTNHVSAYDYTELNNKDAAIIIKGGNQYSEIDVLAGNKGAVYVYGDDTEVLTLDIASTQPGGVRLTDALVGEINYSAATALQNNQGIFTTGAAAIKEVKGILGTGFVYPFWTGKALSDYAVNQKYEGAEVKDDDYSIASGAIYTAAQLQGAGLDKSLETAGSAWTSGSAVTAYTISQKVSKIQLGGDRYPWLGGQIGELNPDDTEAPYASDRSLSDYDFLAAQLSDDVTIDGNNIELTNMEMAYNDPYVKDPHKCCTSCGDYFVKVDQDLGLFRNILTTGAVTINNIYLNNVTLVAPDQFIPNVGSIAGRIESAALTMDNNKTTNVEIYVKGNDVGGQIGDAYATDAVSITGSVVGVGYTETQVSDNYVKTTGDNVGGVVGNLNGQTTVVITGASVGLAEVSAFKGSNAGGVAGNFEFGKGMASTKAYTWGTGAKAQYKELAEFTSQVNGKVAVNLLQATEGKDATSAAAFGTSGSNVGGFVGNLLATTTADRENYTPATDKKIEMWGEFKSTTQVLAEGRNAGGLIGYSFLPEGTANTEVALVAISAETKAVHSTNVALATLQATNGNAGGLIGWSYKGNAVIGGGGQPKADGTLEVPSTVTVTNTTLAAASSAAGLVGQNSDEVDISGLYRPKAAGATAVATTITNFQNTWTRSQFESGYAYAGNSAMTKKLAGTFAGLVGWGNNPVKIRKDNVAVSPARIPAATKLALFFDVNPDGINTHGVETDYYYGDHNGFVGYMTNTGAYYIDGAVPQGDQSFNYRVLASEYAAEDAK